MNQGRDFIACPEPQILPTYAPRVLKIRARTLFSMAYLLLLLLRLILPLLRLLIMLCAAALTSFTGLVLFSQIVACRFKALFRLGPLCGPHQLYGDVPVTLSQVLQTTGERPLQRVFRPQLLLLLRPFPSYRTHLSPLIPSNLYRGIAEHSEN